MPVHNWSRVRAGTFHHFHNSWIYKLSDRLNSGLLPPDFYAAGEQISGDIEPDVLALQSGGADLNIDWSARREVAALAKRPPLVKFVVDAEGPLYAKKEDHLVIRHASGDRIVAMIEIVSRGNKDSRARLEQFLRRAAAALNDDIHLLIIDVHQPTPLAPQGMHASLWEYLFGAEPELPGDLSRAAVSYRAADQITAYLEPLGVGEPLPEMPLFLDPEWYISVPLESTYADAYRGLPANWRGELDGAP